MTTLHCCTHNSLFKWKLFWGVSNVGSSMDPWLHPQQIRFVNCAFNIFHFIFHQ